MGHLQLFTWSKTRRLLLNGPQECELTLDQTTYPDGFSDYELEIENKDPETITAVQQDLEEKYSFKRTPQNSNQNKVARALKHRK